MLECHRLLPLPRQPVVQYIHHFQKGHVRTQPVKVVGLKPAGMILARLPPDLEVQLHL
jgi:hypothetical protein